MKKIIQLIFLILGTVIGAGYASGREIWLFFGPNSGRAIILFTLIFAVACYSTLKIAYQYQTHHYQQIFDQLFHKSTSWIYDLLMFVYLLLTTIIMIAGSGAVLEVYHIPVWVGIVIMGIMVIWAFSFSIDQVIELNSILVPILISLLLAVLISFLAKEQHLEYAQQPVNYIKTIAFTSVNLLPIISVIGAIGHKISNKSTVFYTSLISSVILGTVTLIYNYGLTLIQLEIDQFQMPIYGILIRFPNYVLLVVSIIIWVAIFGTVVGLLLGLVTRIKNKYNVSQLKIVMILFTVLTPFAFSGFQTLIELIYPVYGVINSFILLKLILYPIKDAINKK